MSQNEQWHLDKRVPVTMILAILIQGIGFVWFISSLSSNFDNLSIRVQQNSTEIRRTVQRQQQQAQDGAAMKQELLGISRSLDRLDRGQEITNELLRKLIPTE